MMAVTVVPAAMMDLLGRRHIVRRRRRARCRATSGVADASCGAASAIAVPASAIRMNLRMDFPLV